MGLLGIFKKKNKNDNANKYDNIYDIAKQYVERIEKAIEDIRLGKNANFKLIVSGPQTMYYCIVYKARDDVKVVYFGYGLDNTYNDNLAISICIFLVKAIRNPNDLTFMRFDQEPGFTQISAINNEIYIANEDAINDRIEAARLQVDQNVVIKYSDHVEINIYECAKQVIEDIERTPLLFLLNKEEMKNSRRFFDRYLETLKLMVKAQKNKLDSKEASRLRQNLTIIEEFESAEERLMAFWKQVGHAFIRNMSQEERKTYKKLLKQRDTAFNKF